MIISRMSRIRLHPCCCPLPPKGKDPEPVGGSDIKLYCTAHGGIQEGVGLAKSTQPPAVRVLAGSLQADAKQGRKHSHATSIGPNQAQPCELREKDVGYSEKHFSLVWKRACTNRSVYKRMHGI